MSAHEPGPGPASFPRPFGKYTLLSHLAIGGMADVFLAQQKGPAGFEKECVIKRILPHLGVDQEFVQMFLDEARIAARLSHPNIVQIFDLGQEGSDYFLAMEFIDGINLEHIMEEARSHGQEALPWPLAVRIVADVAAGLDHAHNVRDSSGRPLLLVHRDVSPSNIMVSWGGAAKILDFGIAKAVVSSVKKSRTEVGTIKGKIPYMSPEQLQGFALDGRSDVFSLAVILYEATCGVRPFPADTPGQLTLQILHEDPRAPEQHVPGYPAGLRAVLLRALAKKPEDRWQTAREFELALEQCFKDQHRSFTSYDVEAYLREIFPEGRRPRRLQSRITGTEQTEVSQQIGRVAMPLPPHDQGKGNGSEGGNDEGSQNQSAHAMSGGQRAEEPRERQRMKRDHGARLDSVTGLHQGPAGSMADLPQRFDELDEADVEQRRPRKGGGGAVSLVIFLLVAGTAVGFYFMRGYVIKQEQADSQPGNAPSLGAAGTAVVKPPETRNDTGPETRNDSKPGPDTRPVPGVAAGPDTKATPPPGTTPGATVDESVIKEPARPIVKEPVRTARPVERPRHFIKRPSEGQSKPASPASEDAPVVLPRLPTPPPPDTE